MEHGTTEYLNECYRIFNEGGTLWLIERIDTGEFYSPSMEPEIHSSKYGIMPRYCNWTKDISLWNITGAYLSKNDAENDLRFDIQYGCPNCGHGGIKIKITEHQFIEIL